LKLQLQLQLEPKALLLMQYTHFSGVGTLLDSLDTENGSTEHV
jgi:hypothetical protein